MGWREGVWVEGVTCEDVPCCGCCGRNLYGADESYDEQPDEGAWPEDYYDDEEDEEGPFDATPV